MTKLDGGSKVLASPIPTKAKSKNIQVSPAVLDTAPTAPKSCCGTCELRPAALRRMSLETVRRTLGPNEVAQEKPQAWPIRVLRITRNPLVILLSILSAISFDTGDARTGIVMVA